MGDTPVCEHCGSNKILSGPPDCPTCGAPVCCQVCCKMEKLERQLASLHTAIEQARMVNGLLTQRAERAEAELAAFRADAERYRWLMENAKHTITLSYQVEDENERTVLFQIPETTTEAIDAAIAARKGEQ